MHRPGVHATVILLTFNAGEKLVGLIESLERQVTDFAWDALAVDSGSSDGTCELLARWKRCRLERISNEQFQHGRTRNMAIGLTEAPVVCLLTQSSLPVDEHWLARLVAPFAASERVAAVYGRHVPRPGCCAYVAADVEATFRWISPGSDDVWDALGPGERLEDLGRSERDRRRFFSDANAALRRAFWAEHPYPEVDYAEDQLMGEQILRAGRVKVFCSGAAVYHSHSLPAWRYLQRRFDEFSGLVDTGQMQRSSLAGCVRRSLSRWRLAVGWARASGPGGWWARHWAGVSAGGHALADGIAEYAAGRVARPTWLGRRLSLEASAKRRGRSGR